MAFGQVAAGDVITASQLNEIVVQSTAPTGPTEGQLWVDTSVSGDPVLKKYNGTAFVEAGGGGLLFQYGMPR
jgi:hypothetical protein